MNTKLMQYAQTFEQEVLAYKNLSQDEFIKQFINNWYCCDSDDEYTLISEYFDPLEIQNYKNNDFSYFEICLGCGWPNIYLNVNTRWESVEYTISWWGNTYSIDLSHLYQAICDIYSLEMYG